MADWWQNRLTVRGEQALLERMLEDVRGADGLPLDFERVRPTPPEGYLEQVGVEAGFDTHGGWLIWRHAYWGTKWNLDIEDFRLEGSPAAGELTFFFETADGAPVPLVEELARQHLALDFKLVYVDYGQYMAGCVWCRLGVSEIHRRENHDDAVDLLDRLGWIDMRDVMRELLAS
jgi:hypothetical protein